MKKSVVGGLCCGAVYWIDRVILGIERGESSWYILPMVLIPYIMGILIGLWISTE